MMVRIGILGPNKLLKGDLEARKALIAKVARIIII